VHVKPNITTLRLMAIVEKAFLVRVKIEFEFVSEPV
jgi:hypothetical protein